MKNRIVWGAPAEGFAGYAKAVVAGPMIYRTGTAGPDENGDLPETAAGQTRNIPATADETPGQAGSGLTEVEALRAFLTGKVHARDAAVMPGGAFRDIRPTDMPVACQSPAEGVKVEIEVSGRRG